MSNLPKTALDGVTVLDCTHILSGPFCTMLLADMGAEVIKIEPPGQGEDGRRSGYFLEDNYTSHFVMVNRGKKSVAIDLKNDEGKRLFRAMVAQADVLVENFRPGTMGKLGLAYEDLLTERPDLIYCSISGFGQTGPYRDRGGFDIVAQALSGIMSVNGPVGGPPMKLPVALGDLNAGMYAAYAVLAALYYRSHTGRGQYIDVALLDSILPYLCWESAELWFHGSVPGPTGAAHRDRAPYEPIPAADGDVVVGAGNQRTWEYLCEALGRKDLVDDERFLTNRDRYAHRAELKDELAQVMRTRSAVEWAEVINEAGCPAALVQTLDRVYSDAQILERHMVVEVEDARLGHLRHIGVPPKLSLTPGRADQPAPRVGEHTVELLQRIGLSPRETEDLMRRGVVFESGT